MASNQRNKNKLNPKLEEEKKQQISQQNNRKLIQDNIKDQWNKHFFFENINKIDKPLARITKKREDQNKLN